MMRLGLLLLLAGSAHPQSVDFARDVEPIFRTRCQPCHGPAQQMNGLRLDQAESALKGSYSGPVIVAGNSAASKLFQRISSDKKGFGMPPVGARLSPAEVRTLQTWIDQGAKWPPTQAAVSAAPKSSHWSFQPIRRPAAPAVRNRDWPRNGIDSFVVARLESEGLAPSPEADRRTLMRRVALDLTGLPPTPEEVSEFLADNRPDAYEHMVDRLLASPHYGEKLARQWLDLARYADSDGYEKDLVRPWAWRWRNWVIDALNRDMPFDEFTIQQIAGDLLPRPTVDQRIATGFHRNTLTNREAGVDRTEARFEQIINRTNTVGTVWLGLTVGCAQCHNHKFDPITQKDYYSLFAFFNSADEDDIDAPLPGETGPYLRTLPEYRRQRNALLDEYHAPELQAEWERNIRAAITEPGKNLEWDFNVTSMKAMLDGAVRILNTDPAKRTERQAKRLTDYFVANPGIEIGKNKELSARLKELREKLNKLEASLPPFSQAPVIAEDPQATKTHIAIKGDYRAPGVAVEPDTPAFLPPLPSAKRDRLALARWIVARENPLAARVAVNRIWQECFGRGLVRTSEDFGTQGENASHPELLEWLASEFVDRGWSIKQTARLIVTSATYRQSSNARPELKDRDPDNALLARQSRVRLSAELIRDLALTASGLLNTAIGGRSVRPPQPAGIAELGYGNSVKWKESTGADRYRRGLYIHYQRTTPYPQLVNFDEPDSNVACARRRVSDTPLQALNLLNDPVFFEAAQALAVRVIKEAPAPDFPARLEYAYQLTLGRKPSARERERLAKYYDQQLGMLRGDPKSAGLLAPVHLESAEPLEAAAWTGVARVLLNLDEFITRE